MIEEKLKNGGIVYMSNKTHKVVDDLCDQELQTITNKRILDSVNKCTNENIARYVSVDKETINKILDEVFIETRM